MIKLLLLLALIAVLLYLACMLMIIGYVGYHRDTLFYWTKERFPKGLNDWQAFLAGLSCLVIGGAIFAVIIYVTH